jgi:hypothetical protein
MKLTLQVTFDPMEVSAKEIKDKLLEAGIPLASIALVRARERSAKPTKTAKAVAP